MVVGIRSFTGPNAPFGARCFLTDQEFDTFKTWLNNVLMHLLALGAF